MDEDEDAQRQEDAEGNRYGEGRSAQGQGVGRGSEQERTGLDAEIGLAGAWGRGGRGCAIRSRAVELPQLKKKLVVG